MQLEQQKMSVLLQKSKIIRIRKFRQSLR